MLFWFIRQIHLKVLLLSLAFCINHEDYVLDTKKGVPGPCDRVGKQSTDVNTNTTNTGEG